MRASKTIHWVVGLVLLLLILPACGGGGGGGGRGGGGVIAPADSFTWIGNTPIRANAANAPNLLANDPAGSVISPSSATTTQGGTVTVNANGTFDYTPAPGFKGTDTFTYTVAGAPPKTVTIQIDSMAWYVDTAAAAGGNGSFGSPFNGLAAAIGPTGAAAPGDTIFVFANAATPVSDGAAITLQNGQKLLGEGAAFTFPALADAPPVEIVPASATRPILSDNAVPVVTLADSNEVAGFQIISGLADPESGAIFGTGVSGVNIHDNLIPAATGVGINLTNVSGTTLVADNTITDSGADGISIAMDSVTALTALMTVTGNTVDGAGGAGGGIIAEVVGDNQLTIILGGNTVSNSTGESGVFLLSGDTAELKAKVDSNTLQGNQGVGPLDFGSRARGPASTLCLELTNNTSNIAPPDTAFLLENDGANTGTFQFFALGNTGAIEQAGAITSVPAGTCGVP
jgi:hypothetical protein